MFCHTDRSRKHIVKTSHIFVEYIKNDKLKVFVLFMRYFDREQQRSAATEVGFLQQNSDTLRFAQYDKWR